MERWIIMPTRTLLAVVAAASIAWPSFTVSALAQSQTGTGSHATGQSRGGGHAIEGMHKVAGSIVKILPDRGMLIVDHEAIPDVMAAMTMGLKLEDPSEIEGLSVGDRIEFIMHAKNKSMSKIKKIE